ncbi:MAG: hypothetical protein V2A77_04975, partial [Pseudomonadota bacterium]
MKTAFPPRAVFSKKTLFLERTWLPLALVAVVGAIYLSTLSVNHTEAEDSLTYLTTIARGSLAEQFHPNHLLYSFSNHVMFAAWRAFGYTGNAGLPTAALNCLAGVGSLWLIFRLCLGLGRSPSTAAFCCLGTAFSYGFWWYSVECETYILPLPFILLCFHRLLSVRWRVAETAPHVVLGLLSAGAILFHQQHILLGAVVLVAYLSLLAEGGDAARRRALLRGAGLYVATCFVVVFLSYLAVARLAEGLTGWRQTWTWILGHAAEHGEGWGPSSLALALVGLGRAFIGGHYIFSFHPVAAFLQRLMPNFILREEVFLVRDFSLLKSGALAALSLAVGLGAAVVVVAGLRDIDLRAALRRRPVVVALAAYLVLYAAFNTWWE